MSKLYKGWEIAKMIDEGVLKDGDKIKSPLGSEYEIYMGGVFSSFGKYVELGSSMLASNSAFYEIIPKVQEPVSFMDAVNSDKRCRVEHKLIDGYYSIHTSQPFGKYLYDYHKLYIHMHALSEVFNDEKFKDIIKNGKWYLEE